MNEKSIEINSAGQGLADDGANRPLGYERVHLPLHNVTDAPFHIQGAEIVKLICD